MTDESTDKKKSDDPIAEGTISVEGVVKSGGKSGGKKKDKKKAGRTRGLKSLQCAEDHLSKSGRILSEALDSGFKNYRKKRKKSAEKKKDGAFVDFLENATSGVSKTLSEGAPALDEVAKSLTGRSQTKKQLRRAAKAVSGLVPFIR